MFAASSIIGISNHEIWLDESHHWLLARDSNSILDLYNNMRYEGHPLLWNLILFTFTRFSDNVAGMQIINVIISIGAVTLFLFYSPFTKLEKVLFVTGNFILYEYTVISRNYALLIFLLFLSIILFQRKKYIALGITLALLANTHLFGLVMGSAMIMLWFFEIFIQKSKTWNTAATIGLIVFISGALISVFQIIPPHDSTLYQNIARHNETERMARTSTVFLKGFIPISDFTNYYFWNTNLLMAISKPLCAVLSLCLLIYPIIFFRKHNSILLYFYISTGIMLVFFYLSDLNAPRYYGIIYMTFISACWLSRGDPFNNAENKLDGQRKIFFTGVLIIQSLAGIINYSIDLTRPFSESKHVFTFLKSRQTQSAFIAGGCGAAPISAYLGEKMYYIANENYGSFCSFNREAENRAGDENFLKKGALKFAHKNTQAVYFITHSPLHLTSGEAQHFHLKAAFDKSALRKENYFVYEVSDSENL
jgi:hypothetical protein